MCDAMGENCDNCAYEKDFDYACQKWIPINDVKKSVFMDGLKRLRLWLENNYRTYRQDFENKHPFSEFSDFCVHDLYPDENFVHLIDRDDSRCRSTDCYDCWGCYVIEKEDAEGGEK